MVHKIKYVILSLLFSTSLFSCTKVYFGSNEVKTNLAKPPESKRIYAPELTKAKEKTGIVVVKLDKGTILAPLICPQEILVDLKPVAKLYSGEKIILYLPPGIHNLQTIPQSVCKVLPSAGLLTTTFNLKENEKYIFRIKRGYEGAYYITLESKERINDN